ncbi:MAG: hypothetical protein NC910_04525 [Candidatus Omnitrophica bacterium]|nr:hypothetical protein [Candidatus Omnitrophota bacterium]
MGVVSCFFTAAPTAAEAVLSRAYESRAMWVWDAGLLVKPDSRSRLLEFCRRHGIDILYVSAYNLKAPMDKVYRDFNRQAHSAGLRVHALAGDPRWGMTRYHAVPMQWVESIRQLNAAASPSERFDGIHTDIEVYLLSKSWNERPAELLGGFLDLHARIADALQADSAPLHFGVDIPFWFDDDSNYRILWRGQIKPASYHVIDTADSVTVLAYRNFAEGPDGTIFLVQKEIDYAEQIGKTVMVGQETQDGLFPAYVTFGGQTCSDFMRELVKVRTALGSKKSFGGFAIHHYESYRKLCKD